MDRESKEMVTGTQFGVYEILNPLPMVFAPATLVARNSRKELIALVESTSFDEQTTLVTFSAGQSTRQLTPARISDVEMDLQSIRFRVDSPKDTVLMINQTYFDDWVVRAGQRTVKTFPVNLDRLGIEIPQGEWTVEARFSRRRGLIWISLFLSALSLLSVTGWIMIGRARHQGERAFDPST